MNPLLGTISIGKPFVAIDVLRGSPRPAAINSALLVMAKRERLAKKYRLTVYIFISNLNDVSAKTGSFFIREVGSQP